ncbi:hypothetical protein JCM19992_19160 [Thermostilla marina]
MNRNKHLLLWSSIGLLTLLVIAAVEENFLRSWRVAQREARAVGVVNEVRLRQIVVPELNVTDRCVSCHVGMAPDREPSEGQGLLSAHKSVVHDPAQIGCTVCHGGQGRATEADDAHGQVRHWPHPMLPLRYAYAGCGTCHTHLEVAAPEQLEWGAKLVERYDCLACHPLAGRGGSLRLEQGIESPAPDLTLIGGKGFDPHWYEKHLQRFDAASEGPWHDSFGPVAEPERRAIEQFLRAQIGAPELVRAKAVFHSVGCRGCHKIRGVGGDDGPDLTLVGEKNPHLLDFSHVEGEHTLANWLAAHLRNPPLIVPDSKMPVLGLSDEEIDLLVLYLLSLRESSFPEAYWPTDRVRVERLGQREFATDGRTLYGTFCAGCHGRRGQGQRFPGGLFSPAIINADLLSVATDDYLRQTVAQGRPERRMPAWNEAAGGLREEEITALIDYLRAEAGVPKPVVEPTRRRWVQADAKTGARLYAAHCAACHGAEGEGPEAPALSNRAFLTAADDTLLVETIRRGRRGTSMPAFGAGSPAYPTLSDEQIHAIVAFLRTWEK